MEKLFQMNKNLIIIILAIVLVVSFLFSYLVYTKFMGYYKSYNSLRLSPLGLSNLKEYSIKGKNNIILWGDSRISHWPEANINDSLNIINLGIGGETTKQSLLRMNYLPDSNSSNIILIQLGINDLKTIALFPSKKQNIINNCKKHIDRIVGKARQKNYKVILSTIIPAGKVSLLRKLLFWNKDIPKAVKEVNNYIRSLANKNSIYLLDLYNIVENSNNKYKLYKDELHLNQKGYTLLNSSLKDFLHRINIGL